MPHTFYEFFAGGGMARAGLGERWQCLFANDFSAMKVATYAENWGASDILCADIAKVRPETLPGTPDLAWASFPCQDLSLAGNYRGLADGQTGEPTRSGTFWPFWALVQALQAGGRAPQLVVLENVVGALTAKGGKDFAAICGAFSEAGYRFGALVMDARHHVPQSRARVFFVGLAPGCELPKAVQASRPILPWHSRALVTAQSRIGDAAKRNWIWWDLPEPAVRTSVFADLIEEQPTGCNWHTPAQTAALLALMSPLHLAKVHSAQAQGVKLIGAVYKRTRVEQGKRQQRAEVRFDDVAGCLRTPGGGSSRQTILVIEGAKLRSRLLSPREAARLMGLPESYKLPERYNDAYKVAGDGVCVPVVRHLSRFLLEPLLATATVEGRATAAK